MNTRYTTVNLDVSQQGSIPSITLSQYDLGVGLGFYIMDGGMPYSEFAETDTVVLSGTKPSGVGFTVPAYYKSGNLCSFRTPQSMTTEAGTVTCEITITKVNNISVSTANFFVEVEASAHAHVTVDEDIEDFSLIANQVGEYKAVAVRAAQQAAQSATDAASSASSAEESMEAAQSAASSAIAAKDDIQEYIDDSEAWAKGTRGGTEVPSTDETYHNNAKYYAERSSQDAEAWARGTRGGTAVPQTDEAYHNNAKYYAEQSSQASMDAGSSASEAAASAQEAAAILAGTVKPAAIDTEFSTSTAYAVGDTVVYQGRLYEFTSAHAAGAWNASHVQAISIMDEVSDLKGDLTLKVIPNNADLNNYAVSGNYVIDTSNYTIANYPRQVSEISFLRVDVLANRIVVQRLVLCGSRRAYIRYRLASGSWNTWVSLTPDTYSDVVRYDIEQTKSDEAKALARSNLGITDVPKYIDIGSLTQSVDLNNFAESGLYCFQSNALIDNYPLQDGKVVGGHLSVIADYTSGLVSQTLMIVGSGKLYTRWRYGNGTWGAWQTYVYKHKISMLFVGNSLTQDGIAYLPYVLKNAFPEIDFKFYIWYNGGKTPEQHYEYFVNNTPCQIFSVCENGASWTNYNNSKTMSEILNSYSFDIVSIQEYLNVRTQYTETEAQGWENCKKYIQENYSGGNPLKFVGYFQASNQADDTAKYTLSLSANKYLLENTIAEDIIPAGFAIHEARKTDLNSLGDLGHLTPDNTHTQEGLPCLLQTLTITCWLLDLLAVPKSVYGIATRITTDVYNSINVPGPNLGTGVITGTEAQNILAQEVAIKAYKKGRAYMMKWLVDGVSGT